MHHVVRGKGGAGRSAAWPRIRSGWRVLRSVGPPAFTGPIEAASDNASLPSILVVSIPKSGTIFTNLVLSRGLRLEPVSVSFGYFPHYLVEIPKVAAFITGGKVARGHFDASPVNLQSLTAFVNKWVLHIRDPRSVLLSWVHHMNRLYQERCNGEYQHLFVYPSPPERYFQWPFCRQVDWSIDNFLPSAVSWTRS